MGYARSGSSMREGGTPQVALPGKETPQQCAAVQGGGIKATRGGMSQVAAAETEPQSHTARWQQQPVYIQVTNHPSF